MMLKQSGSKYKNSILNSPDNLSKYNSNYKKALNMGIYGADLGYTNIYGQNMDGVQYLSAIKSLADDLNIGQFFDIATIAKLAANSNNLDSLLLVTTQNFNAINHYLQTENRSNLSILLLVGGWIEAMEIMCQVAESQNFKNKVTSYLLSSALWEKRLINFSISLTKSAQGQIAANLICFSRQASA